MKQCPLCKGNLKAESITKESIWGENKVSVTNVPTLSCYCGTDFFHTDVANRLQKFAIKFGDKDCSKELDFNSDLI